MDSCDVILTIFHDFGQIWDLNILSSNDAIGEAVINLKALYTKAMKKNARESIKRQIVSCRHPTKGEDVRGKIELQIDLIPGSDAQDQPGNN
jgi:hypothetical protein